MATTINQLKRVNMKKIILWVKNWNVVDMVFYPTILVFFLLCAIC